MTKKKSEVLIQNAAGSPMLASAKYSRLGPRVSPMDAM